MRRHCIPNELGREKCLPSHRLACFGSSRRAAHSRCRSSSSQPSNQAGVQVGSYCGALCLFRFESYSHRASHSGRRSENPISVGSERIRRHSLHQRCHVLPTDSCEGRRHRRPPDRPGWTTEGVGHGRSLKILDGFFSIDISCKLGNSSHDLTEVGLDISTELLQVLNGATDPQTSQVVVGGEYEHELETPSVSFEAVGGDIRRVRVVSEPLRGLAVISR